MEWSVALKVGGPSVLAVWGVVHLLTEYMEKSSFFKGNIYLDVLALSFIFIFFCAIAWLWLRKTPEPVKERFVGNKVVDNEVQGSLGVKSKEVVNNEFSRNKVGGDFTIGE
ncbi:hypothetical protein [Pseudomonas aeruginosa]|uniref:hypothetical protein n=1 Tax=Pseudomonas aeruginosa TaxID=287 RepID=UPI00106DD057|nr:hypothetical protein [Pseudomonas aeruginosa]